MSIDKIRSWGLLGIWCAIAVIALTSCQNKTPLGLSKIEDLDLAELPIKYRKGIKKSTLETVGYKLLISKKVKKLERGRVEFSGTLKYTLRTVFNITNVNNFVVDAESLFIYTKTGFDRNLVENGTLFGKTSQDVFPFTFSLAADPLSKVFYGKAKRKNIIVDIEGTPFVEENFLPKNRETAYQLKINNKVVGYVTKYGKGAPRLFIYGGMNLDERTVVMYSAFFLIVFDRYRAFGVHDKIIKGE